MKKLILIRHAKSTWAESGISDFDRPLNQRGENDAPIMAGRISSSNFIIDQVVSSPALRAITTAQEFSKVLKIPFESILQNKAIYEASPDVLMGLISQFDSSWKTVILFGHNPGLSYLTGLLTGELYDKVTCSISEIDLHIDDWSHCNAGLGTLISYDFPKNL